MIQDIYPHIFFNQFDKEAVASVLDRVFYIEGPKVLLNSQGQIPCVSDFAPQSEFDFLFRVDEIRYFRLKELKELPQDFFYTDVFRLRREATIPKHQIFAALTAKHLSDWYGDTQFCGRCGSRMKHSEKERAMVCESCGRTAYPRIMPAVIVGAINGDSLLLTKYRVGYSNNALIAGFVEIGETLEETVAREVMEEAGIRVKNIRYYKSQPWGVANDILTGFYCDVDGDTTIHMDPQELKYAQWVKREDIVLQPDDFSLTNEMMQMFKVGKVR